MCVFDCATKVIFTRSHSQSPPFTLEFYIEAHHPVEANSYNLEIYRHHHTHTHNISITHRHTIQMYTKEKQPFLVCSTCNRIM